MEGHTDKGWNKDTTYIVEVLPLLRPLPVREPVVDHLLLPRPVHGCGARAEQGQPCRTPLPWGSPSPVPPCPGTAGLTGGPRALPGVGVPVGVPVVVCHGHVLQAVVLGQGGAGGGVPQPVRGVAQPVAGAVALRWAHGARPLAEVLGVQGVSVQTVLFGPGRRRGGWSPLGPPEQPPLFRGAPLRNPTRPSPGWHLSGVLLLPLSPTSRSSSEESMGEEALASSSSCSCWARYWAGVCLAMRAQCSSSRCSRGRLACRGGVTVQSMTLQPPQSSLAVPPARHRQGVPGGAFPLGSCSLSPGMPAVCPGARWAFGGRVWHPTGFRHSFNRALLHLAGAAEHHPWARSATSATLSP